MNQEIERKFLVKNSSWQTAAPCGLDLVQGYCDTQNPHLTVRVRRCGTHAFLTIKQDSSQAAVRDEFEFAIPLEQADALLLKLCADRLVEKTRYKVQSGQFTWDLDVYHNRNQGLVTAEIELPDLHSAFDRPDWLGAEITADNRYANAALARTPYTTWQQQSF